MGAFGRFGEKVKQAFGCGVGADKDWKPTSNERNTLMLKEAKKFAGHLRMLHRDLTLWSKSIEDGLGTIKAVLETPLPKAYHQTVIQVEAVDPNEHFVGQNVRADVLPQASAVMKTNLQEEVLNKLEQYLDGYKAVKERNKKCQAIRFELDASHRVTVNLQEKHKKIQAKAEKAAEKAEGAPNTQAAALVEESHFKVTTAIDKEKRLNERYTAMEAEIFNALLIQIQDSIALRDLMANSLLIMQNVFTTSYQAFDLNTPIRPPLLPPFEGAEGSGASALVPQPSKVAPTNSLAAPVLMENTNKLRQSMGPSGTTFAQPAGQAPGDNPFGAAAGKGDIAADPNPFSQSTGGAAPAAKGGKGSTQALPPAPAWYTEARAKARAPVDDSDDEDGNPFSARKGAQKGGAYKV